MADDTVDKLKEAVANLCETPEGRAAIDARILSWNAEQQLRDGDMRAAAADVLTVCKKHFPRGGERTANNLDGPEMLAEAIAYFDLEDPLDAGQLYLEWTVEAFVGKKLLLNVPRLERIYELLVEHGHDESNMFNFNDLDNDLFFVKDAPTTVKVWCATSQNTRYMFIMRCSGSGEITDIHVRRYWNPLRTAEDKWDREEREAYNEQGYERAVRDATWHVENFSDNLLGNNYVQRPDLQWWRDCKFDPGFKDCRDEGYVMSLNISRLDHRLRARVDRAIYTMPDIKAAFFEISCADSVLTEEYRNE
jgi:hypothetical protein